MPAADATEAMASQWRTRGTRVQKEMTDAISDNNEAIKALTIVQQGQHQLNITTLQDAKAEVRRLADAVSALATAMAHRGEGGLIAFLKRLSKQAPAASV